ncbi:Bacteriophage protein, Gp10 [Mycoavidus cysteinexigens]|uniref:Bacteriophage protein, Gp10 n=1 Tax=Mycoavidus cysteinexigens TaxID=1553431 RepID=A0A2Z6ET69_9BURK|nr:DUF6475 domain-containing protein [Mycoavidus cysteinexigens]BBE08595.1 Bacteriophage protein, Gp10 [Mycoavidus cysteinexigens]GAM52703.1 hypothetical protein EBME_1166 [bacterium endosymbiont of Mortierella elongata FMR23-6]GLR01541.1 hypothetical protein GCM10007934_13530 [Mycoavidus cysteinexigens]
MQSCDFAAFGQMLQAIMAMYGRDLSPALVALYWQGLQAYDLAAVREALNRHVNNPDTGQFMPKIADIHKMLQGSTQDAALTAWSKVDRTMREKGPYPSIVFDDPLIHRVLSEMGGWVQLSTKHEENWPFVRNEFVNRYRGYRMRSEVPDYPPVLIGIAEMTNQQLGFKVAPPLLVGSAAMAQRVMQLGTHKPLIGFTQLHPKELQIACHQEAA